MLREIRRKKEERENAEREEVKRLQERMLRLTSMT